MVKKSKQQAMLDLLKGNKGKANKVDKKEDWKVSVSGFSHEKKLLFKDFVEKLGG